METIEDAKFKVKKELKALQLQLEMLEHFEKQEYNRRICGTGEFDSNGMRLNHEWTSAQWENGWNGLRYDEDDWNILEDLHICMNCGVMRKTVFKLSKTIIEDPFVALREEE